MNREVIPTLAPKCDPETLETKAHTLNVAYIKMSDAFAAEVGAQRLLIDKQKEHGRAKDAYLKARSRLIKAAITLPPLSKPNTLTLP